MQLDLLSLASDRRMGRVSGITSICSAHPVVLRAALRFAARTNSTVLIEATCNQVNHQGGYTGMQPADFAALVRKIAGEEGCDDALIILGGDHLGPNPWRDRDAETAMAEAEVMVRAYVEAGFRKLHLDASMGCKGEPVALDDATTAHRAARLAAVAEAAAKSASVPLPVYVIGTEVPPPGGADHALSSIEPTAATAARHTIDVHRAVFHAAGLDDAFSRVLALVVQPGVEFGNRNVVFYDPPKAAALTAVLDQEPAFIYEAHSTDYQGTAPLSDLVRDGFQILKVGPELTFALREALYALDLIASDLVPDYPARALRDAMDGLMLAEPDNWRRHYDGDAAEQRLLRHYSLSDRIRYYWAHPKAQAAVDRLFATLDGRSLPLPLVWQHLPAAHSFADHPILPEDILIWRVTQVIESYHTACVSQAN